MILLVCCVLSGDCFYDGNFQTNQLINNYIGLNALTSGYWWYNVLNSSFGQFNRPILPDNNMCIVVTVELNQSLDILGQYWTLSCANRTRNLRKMNMVFQRMLF